MANPHPTNKFEKGNTCGGRSPKIGQIQEFCRDKSQDILNTLIALLNDKQTPCKVKLDIARLLLAYGYGNPSDSSLEIKEHNDLIDSHNSNGILDFGDNTKREHFSE